MQSNRTRTGQKIGRMYVQRLWAARRIGDSHASVPEYSGKIIGQRLFIGGMNVGLN